MMFSSRKAMSPLIATVLLIAFAVALGAMIMNWSADVTPQTVDKSKMCSDMEISISKNPCISDNKLSFGIKNSGSRKINGLMLKAIGDESDMTIKIKGSSLIVLESLTKTVPFLYGGENIRLDFVPMVADGTELIECESAVISAKNLPMCR